MEDQVVICLECRCGQVFELENEFVDADGDRWAICPKCEEKVPLTES